MATRVREDTLLADYDADLAAWCAEQGRLLREGRFGAVDAANVAEEIESLGREQASALTSHLARLIEHLLKLDHSDDEDPRRGWRVSVVEHRDCALQRLEDSPSLRPRLDEMLTRAWKRGRNLAAGGLTEQEARTLPTTLPYTLPQLLDEGYFGGRDAAA